MLKELKERGRDGPNAVLRSLTASTTLYRTLARSQIAMIDALRHYERRSEQLLRNATIGFCASAPRL